MTLTKEEEVLSRTVKEYWDTLYSDECDYSTFLQAFKAAIEHFYDEEVSDV